MKDNPTGAKPKAHYPRNVHDFSARRVYSSKAGLIEPVKPIDTLPNEHIQIDVSDFLQSMPLSTSAFLRGRREFAFYYVPYTQLWSNFGQYMAQRKDRYSSAMKDTKFEPRISLKWLVKWCFDAMIYDILLNEGVWSSHSSDDYQFYLSINNQDSSTIITEDTPFSRIDKVVLHVKDIGGSTWHNHEVPFVTFPEEYFMHVVDDEISTYHPTVGQFAKDRFGFFRWSNMLRKLDMLRYGNFLPLFSPFYDYFFANYKSTDYANPFTLLVALHDAIEKIPSNYYVEPYRLLAYNKVYYTFFRNSFYELDYYVGDFNVDHLQCDSLENSILRPHHFSVEFLDMFQHQWKKDLFTSLMPDTQYGAVSELSFDVSSFTGNNGVIGYARTNEVPVRGDGDRVVWSQHSSVSTSVIDAEFRVDGTEVSPLGTSQQGLFYPENTIGVIADNSEVRSLTGSISGLSGTASFDVLALRRAEAIQGYRQTLLRCGNKTKDIMVGLFGVEPVWESDHDPAFIDAFGYDFAVDRVVSTAQTNDSLDTYDGKLGDLGGYIAKLGNTNHTIKYTTRGDYGVILPVCYNIFETEYNSYNIDPNILALTPEDHGIPDFMNLGFVPVTRRVLSVLPPLNTTPVEDLDKVLGYSSPYYEKKLDIDLVHGIFCSFNSIIDDGINEIGVHQYFGDFSHWVAPRSDMQSALVTTVKQFYIDPRVLNGNFLLAADGRQETDQFICNTYFKVKRTNWLSHLGLPNF